jgi:hypothetical protein
MMQFLNAVLVTALLLGSAVVGLYVRPLLAERHRSQETMDLVRLVTTMLVTFAALVLGLLTTSVKSARDQVNGDLRGFGVMIIELDQTLREFGELGNPIRADLRSYTAAAIASTWTNEPAPPGDYYPHDISKVDVDHRIESSRLGDMLNGIEMSIRRLQPADAMHRRLAADALKDFQSLVQRRWKLIEEASSSISVLFYVVLVFWLAVVFASFGLCAPHNMLVYVMLVLGAVSIGSAVLVILIYDTPFGEWFAAPSEPLRAALRHLNQ